MIAQKALHALQWQIKVDKKGYIEAFVDNSNLLSQFTTQMFTVLIDNNRILFTSTSNVDDFAAYSISWLKDLQEINHFKKTVTLILEGTSGNIDRE